MADVVEALRTRDLKVHVFSEVEPEPSIETADRVTREVRGRRYDLVYGVGGGSVMDIAKIASVMATNAGETKEYLGMGLFRKPGLPKILLPTTAGTGSEMMPNAIVGMRDGSKTALISPHILTDVAIVDPMLTLSLPADGSVRSRCTDACNRILHLLGCEPDNRPFFPTSC